MCVCIYIYIYTHTVPQRVNPIQTAYAHSRKRAQATYKGQALLAWSLYGPYPPFYCSGVSVSV